MRTKEEEFVEAVEQIVRHQIEEDAEKRKALEPSRDEAVETFFKALT